MGIPLRHIENHDYNYPIKGGIKNSLQCTAVLSSPVVGVHIYLAERATAHLACVMEKLEGGFHASLVFLVQYVWTLVGFVLTAHLPLPKTPFAYNSHTLPLMPCDSLSILL